MKFTGLWLSAALLTAGPVFAGSVVAPPDPGNAQGPAPFRYYGSGGSRVQQIYAATFFSGPQSISAFSFRAYPGAAPSAFFGDSVSFSDVIVSLSTTTAGDESGTLPSTTFASNVGGDATTVFAGPLTLTTAATGLGPQPFDYTVNFTTPFDYNPAAGNLLLDINVPAGATVSGAGFGFLTFDTVNTIGDGVFSVVDINDGAATSGVLSTAGAITDFTTAPLSAVPEPAAWALMLIGFGAVGVARRAGRVKDTLIPA